MIPILRRVSKLLVFLILAIACDHSRSTYSTIDLVYKEGFDENFAKYSKLNSTHSFRENAYICTLMGDQVGAVRYATKEALAKKATSNVPELSDEERRQLEVMAADTLNGVDQQLLAQAVLDLETSSKNIDLAFGDVTAADAKEYIVDESKKYHFLLLNEAHHSQQHQAFTTKLLGLLWENGYRYLALEALGHEDTLLTERGYPRFSTGFYIRESVFGNLVREALSLGYTLVPYEAQNALWLSPTDRDREQARNATYKIDSIGKVIFHAGYSHISEIASPEYSPMGYELLQLSGQPIFTVDQQSMTELAEDKAMNPFYALAVNRFKFITPVVFLDKKSKALLSH